MLYFKKIVNPKRVSFVYFGIWLVLVMDKLNVSIVEEEDQPPRVKLSITSTTLGGERWEVLWQGTYQFLLVLFTIVC